jgi:hypothetical protein
MLHIQSPHSLVSQKVLVNEPPLGSPTGAPMAKAAHFQSFLLNISQISYKI